jgi:hypothetical protein
MEDHNRVCRELVRAVNKENDALQMVRTSYCGYGGLGELDEVVDVDHWKEIT